MPDLEQIVEEGGTIAGGNALLACAVQELSKYQKNIFDQRIIGNHTSLLEIGTLGVLGYGGAFLAKKYYEHTKDFWNDASHNADSWYGKTLIRAAQFAAPVAGLFGVVRAIPYAVGTVEEAVTLAAAGGAFFAANKFGIIPAAKKIKEFMETRSNKEKLWKRAGAGLLTAGLFFTNPVQNTIRDVFNSGVAAYHQVAGLGSRDITDYSMQYGLEHPTDQGKVTSRFGFRKTPGLDFEFYELPRGRDAVFHSAVDIGVPVGTEIKAAADGKVIEARGYGMNRTITLDHGSGLITKYRHNSKLNFKVGAEVKEGDIIAFSGKAGTGPHLHFVVQKDGKLVNPL